MLWGRRIESKSNLDLIQPVLPWLGNSWVGYTEHFDWNGGTNKNSRMIDVRAGDVMHGTVTYNPQENSYTQTQTNTRTGETSSMDVPVTDNETFEHFWIVLEKVPEVCSQLPPSGTVTFYDIIVEYDNVKIDPVYTTSYVDDKCNSRAHIATPNVTITWDPNM